MRKRKILVLGANGKTGRRVAKRLEAAGHDLRLGSRSADVPFDWENQATWAAVLENIESVYITFQPDLAVPGAAESIKSFTQAAKKAGVQKLVLLSGKGEKEAEYCEKIIMESGLRFTIVRASWFNQNFSESFFLDPILAGQVALPKNEALVPYVDANDIADVVVAALLNSKHDGQIYELTGPRQLTFEQVTKEIAEATGRNIKFDSISLDQYLATMKEFQVPESYIWLVDYLFTNVLTEKNSVVTDDVEKVLGRKPRDFSEYARETSATGVWNPK